MAEPLGDIIGRVKLDISEAISSYTQLRQKNLSTVSALGQGAGVLTGVGAAFTAVGVAAAAGLGVAIGAAAEFERKLDFFGAVSDATVKEMEQIRQSALQIGADTIYSADQIADSFIELAKAGVGTERILNGIGEAVANLGAAADMPLAEAAVGLTTILNTFQISAENASSVVDKLAGAANASSIEVNDLVLTMTYAGASAATAGIGFEDLNSAIAFLGERGIRGSKAGTGLRQTIDKLIAPTARGAKALEGLGIITEETGNQLLTAEGRLKSLPQVLDILNKSLEGMNQAEKIDILGQIFPITSMPTILNLIEGGSDALSRLSGEINKTTAWDVASKRLDNLSGDLEILRGNLDTLKINFGSTVQGALRMFVQVLIEISQWLNSLSPEMLGFIMGVASIATAATIAIGVLALMAAAFLQLYQAAILLRAVLPLLIGQLKTLAGAAKAAMLALLPKPVLIILGVLTALGAALAYVFTKTEEGRKAWEDITKAFSDAGKEVQPIISELVKAFSKVGSTLVKALVPIFKIVVKLITAVFVPAAQVLASIFGVVAKAIAPLARVITAILVPVLEILAFIINLVVVALEWLFTAFETVFKGITGQLDDNGSEWSNWYYRGIKPVLDSIVQAMMPFTKAVIQAWEWLVDKVQPIVDWWKNTVEPGIKSVVDALIFAWGEFSRWVGEAWENTKKAIAPVWDWLVNTVITEIERRIDEAITAWQEFERFVGEAWTNIRNATQPVVNWLLDTAFPEIEAELKRSADKWVTFGEGVAKVWTGMQDAAKPVAKWFFTDAFPQLQSGYNKAQENAFNFGKGVGEAWGNIRSGVEEAHGWIVNTALPDLERSFGPVGEKVQELRDKFGEAWARMREAVQPIIDRWNNELFPKLQETYNNLRTKVDEVVGRIGEAWQKLKDKLAPIWAALGELIETLQNLFGKFFNSGGDGKSSSPDQAAQPVLSTWDKIMIGVNMAVGAIIAILDLLIGAVEGVIFIFESLFRGINAVMTGAQIAVSTATQFISALFRGEWAAMPDVVKKAWEKLPQGVRETLTNVWNTASTIGQRIKDTFANAGNWLWNAGRDVINGLVRGIESAINKVKDTLKSITNSIPSWKGPANVDRKLLTPTGEMIMNGLITGIENQVGSLRGSLSLVTDTIGSFYDSVYAAREMELSLKTTTDSTVSTYTGSLDRQLEALNETLVEIADKDTIHIEKMETNNPAPETVGDSLPEGIRKAAYIVGA